MAELNIYDIVEIYLKKWKIFFISSLVLLIIPAYIAQQIGTKIRDKINQKQFRNCILITLVILGVMLFAKTI